MSFCRVMHRPVDTSASQTEHFVQCSRYREGGGGGVYPYSLMSLYAPDMMSF